MKFLVHTQNWQFYCLAPQGLERTGCQKHSLRRGFFRQDWGWCLQPFSHQREQVLLFLWKNWIVRDQISPHLIRILSYLILTSLVAISVNFFFFFPYTECSSCDLEKYTPLENERELGEQTSFSYHSQLLCLCSSELFFSPPHLDLSWSNATFGICLTFHVLPN